jgi:hypothetical protein
MDGMPKVAPKKDIPPVGDVFKELLAKAVQSSAASVF